MLFSGEFVKQLLKPLLLLSVCPSMYQIHSHQADCHETVYLRLLLEFVDIIQCLLKFDKNNNHLT